MVMEIPDEDMQVIIRKALNEEITTRDRDLDIIKIWLKQQPHLPDTWDDVCLMNFLRGCSFSLEKCKRKLDMYFTMRAMVPELFADRDISRPELRKVSEFADLVVLPGLTPDGKRVSLGACAKGVFDLGDIASIFKYTLMVGDMRLKMETVGVSGDVYVLDADFELGKHFMNVSLATVKKFFICIQEAYPVKIKEVHIVNVNAFVDMVFTALKPFMKEKLKKRIYLHQNIEALYEYIPKDMMPEEYGGKAGTLGALKKQWMKKLEEFTTWFQEQEYIRADETKRPGKPATHEDLFGLDGSFRQLSID